MKNRSYPLTITNLTFSFNQHTPPLVNNLSARFEPGKLNFVRGSNGTGKSTLFRILQGKINEGEIISGTIAINGTESQLTPGKPAAQLSQQIRMVAQDTNSMIADQCTFEQNLRCATMPSYPGLRPLPKANLFAKVTDHFNIDPHKPVALLSGGQRQILATLMVLQKPTQILLLDEPTAALDSRNAQMLMQFLQELAQALQITIVIICHDEDLIKIYGNSTILELLK